MEFHPIRCALSILSLLFLKSVISGRVPRQRFCFRFSAPRRVCKQIDSGVRLCLHKRVKAPPMLYTWTHMYLYICTLYIYIYIHIYILQAYVSKWTDVFFLNISRKNSGGNLHEHLFWYSLSWLYSKRIVISFQACMRVGCYSDLSQISDISF